CDYISEPSQEGHELVLGRQPSPLAAAEPQVLQDFVDGFLPGDTSLHSGTWLPKAMQLAHYGSDTDAATFSLRALAMVRVGYRWQDYRMVVASREAYGLALRALQSSLNKPDPAALATAIASCRFLSSYEMFIKNGNATEPDQTWMVHQAGLEQLLTFKQAPDANNELLRGTTDLIMRRAIAQRRAPDVNFGKKRRREERESEMGCKFAGILQKLDACEASAQGSPWTETHRELVMRLVKLDQDLQSWHLGMSLARKAATSNYATEEHEIYTYPSFDDAKAILIHWALRILISRTIASTASHHTDILEPSTSGTDTDFLALIKSYSKTQRSECALHVLRSSWYFANGDYRAAGYVSYSFAHHQAIEVLLEDPKTVASNPWLKRLPLAVLTKQGLPIHGTPPPVPPRLDNLCVMAPYAKMYYGWPFTRGLI
ncbi:MAG: hypothetical protein Q9159_007762, partial [Coniocarpon cinnabarinum]